MKLLLNLTFPSIIIYDSCIRAAVIPCFSIVMQTTVVNCLISLINWSKIYYDPVVSGETSAFL